MSANNFDPIELDLFIYFRNASALLITEGVNPPQ